MWRGAYSGTRFVEYAESVACGGWGVWSGVWFLREKEDAFAQSRDKGGRFFWGRRSLAGFCERIF
jgi:hypothetical protein